MKYIKNNLRLVTAVLISSIIIAFGLVIIYYPKTANTPESPVKELTREEEIIKRTGIDGLKAITLAKDVFDSSNYEYSYELEEDDMYKVIIKSINSDEIYTYFVDPVTKTAYLNIDNN